MRICFLSKQFNPNGGGSERYAFEIASALARRGNDVDVFALGQEASLNDTDLPDNLDVTIVAKRHRYLVTFETLYYSILTRGTVEFNDYDIIHGTLMPASPIALTISSPSTPIVVTSHGSSIGEVRSHKLEVPTDYLKKLFFHPMNVGMDIATMHCCSQIVAISSIAQQELERYYPVNQASVSLIPHGVDIERFHPDQSLHQAVNPDSLTLLHVGRLVSRKHIDLAFKLLSTIERDNIELLVAGSGTHHERLKELAEQLSIRKKVSFLGFVPEDELASLYASSDLFLFFSRYEGFGLTFLEAMASGTPVVGVPTGGFPDLVTDGRQGFIVERDITEIVDTVEKFSQDPDKSARMESAARELAESRTWDDVAAETEHMYKDTRDDI